MGPENGKLRSVAVMSAAATDSDLCADATGLGRGSSERHLLEALKPLALLSSSRMLGDPNATVIIPTLNSAAFLETALCSLAAQRGVTFEVVVVDGGSADGTIEILRRHEAVLPLRWISEADHGQADAINKGLRMSSGEIVSWLNADDALLPGALAQVRQVFAADEGLDMLSGLGILTGPSGQFVRVIPVTPIQRLDDLYRFGCYILQPSTFLRRRVFEQHGPLDIEFEFAMDFEYYLRIGRTVRYQFRPELLSRFRLHPASKSVSQHDRFWREEKRAFRRHGGSWHSPFFLAHFYDSKVIWASYLLATPLRWITWPLFGLSRNEWLRPGPPPLLETEAAPRDSNPDRVPSGRVA
jgi:glycosyltransferase involved in cell wall biosynthesis